MKENLQKVLSSKNYVVSENLIKVAFSKSLALNEFVVLMYLVNKDDALFDLDTMGKALGIDSASTMQAFNSLMMKGLVSLNSVKDESEKFNEVVKLDGYYDILMEDISMTDKEEKKNDLFKTFENGLGRTMSSMELELIRGWLESGTPEELIIGALKEAVYNNVRNFRYIDKIIYEWEKKGFKTMQDVNNHMRNRREEMNRDKAISKKEQEILDYDWIDG